jgi:SecY interacting protein Syd
VDHQTAEALQAFTQRYCAAWQHSAQPAAQRALRRPVAVRQRTDDDGVFWQPQPFSLAQNISAVERALDIVVQQPLHAYYTTQFAGDMPARFADETHADCCRPGVKMISSGCRKT